MKILCDVCGKGEAIVYCAADEASLCAVCDHRVHHANKLAGKHQRFSLLHPSPKLSPVCDICQERKAFLFCLEDRAILCRECDIPIHKANQHTQKHTRFLLTGVRVSATPALYSESTAVSDNDAVPKNKSGAPTCTPPAAKGTSKTPTAVAAQEQDPTEKSCSNLQFSTSSISEYLIETLPGWHVEDLLDSSSPPPPPPPPPSGCCKSGENDLVLPLWDADIYSSSSISSSGFPTENMGPWVPRVQLHHQTQNQSSLDNNSINFTFGIANVFKEFSTNSIKSNRKRREDNSFAVPQITPPSAAFSKRSRSFW